MRATPTDVQAKDVDFLHAVGELFTLVVYAQLVLENAAIYAEEGVAGDTVDQIFDVLVRDFSRQALELYVKPACTPSQMDYALKMVRKPHVDAARYDRGATTINPTPSIVTMRSRYRLPPIKMC